MQKINQSMAKVIDPRVLQQMGLFGCLRLSSFRFAQFCVYAGGMAGLQNMVKQFQGGMPGMGDLASMMGGAQAAPKKKK